ncbi:hypothetical protein EV426DRAFT_711749 [Tirmania nivea]|nr:hypothetical protein EV426DRAFT_711749 [Tirmania nivea]
MKFPSTTPIYMFFFSMFGMLSAVTAAAIPNPGAAAVDGTGVPSGIPFWLDNSVDCHA